MARVTVEDCVEKLDNRFELVLLSAHRARAISAGSEPTVHRDNDKNPVVALREIAVATVGVEELRDDYISGMQKRVETEEPEAETVKLLLSGQGSEIDDSFGNAGEMGGRMSEEELLRAIQNQIDLPQQKSADADDAELDD